MKNIIFFLSESFPFLVVKSLLYLNRRVFVMKYNLFIYAMLLTVKQTAVKQ